VVQANRESPCRIQRGWAAGWVGGEGLLYVTWGFWGQVVLDGLKKTGELSWQETHCLDIVFGYRNLCMKPLFRTVL
jgi:hypothetical protein